MSVAPARRVAYRVIRRVAEDGAYADRALHAEAGGMEPRDRGLAMALAYGSIQRRRTLDHVIDGLSRRPAARLDPPVRAALELGLFQLLLMDGIAAHAAVNDSVSLVKAAGVTSSAGLVNAVLRRAQREAPALLAALDDTTPERAAILHSVPDWLASMWFSELGPVEARALLAAVNRPPESAVRINTLKVADLDGPWHPAPAPAGAPALPEGRVLDGPYDVFGSDAWQAGQLMPQSRASMLVARTLDPRPGERVLDMCAAPGAKTTHLAALMEGAGQLVAIEVHPGRADALARTCERMGAANVRVLCADAADEHWYRQEFGDTVFDRVLLDPPCSGLGTLQSRPDIRWQPRRGQLAELAARQGRLLAAAAKRVAPGGTLVYSLCTLSAAESDGVLGPFLADNPGLRLESARTTTPHRDGTDGFFIARLRAETA